MHFNTTVSELLAQKGALPDPNDVDYPWSWNPGAVAAGADACASSSAVAITTDDVPLSLRPKLKQRLLQQWITLKVKY
jgi:hypothetical protein